MRGLPRSTNSQPGAGLLSGDETKAVTEFAEPAVNLADCSGSWYHAAAILESKPGLDR